MVIMLNVSYPFAGLVWSVGYDIGITGVTPLNKCNIAKR